MSKEFFFHYTDADSAQQIFLSGKILPSASTADAIHGNGVYLTTCEPSLGREVIANNNWGILGLNNQIVIKKMECFFEVWLPSNKVKRAKDGRDIQVYEGVLVLANYKWNLKGWDGKLLATQHFMVRSEGEAARCQSSVMGRYTICGNMVTNDDHPVYKKDDAEIFLYTFKNGNWTVGPKVGANRFNLFQNSEKSASPNKTKEWWYASGGKSWTVDKTLKVYACY